MLKIEKRKKKMIVLAAVVCLIAVGAFYLWHDLHLGAAEKIPLPDIVVEDINIERVIEGKNWKLLSPRVEHKEGFIYGVSLDVTITEPNGKETQIYADNGVLARESNDLSLVNADGVTRDNGKEYRLKSKKVDYDASTEIWHFAEGVTLTDGHMVIAGKTGYYEMKSGECRITDEGTITWSDR